MEFSLWVGNFEFGGSFTILLLRNDLRSLSCLSPARFEENVKCLVNLGDINPFINDRLRLGVDGGILFTSDPSFCFVPNSVVSCLSAVLVLSLP